MNSRQTGEVPIRYLQGEPPAVQSLQPDVDRLNSRLHDATLAVQSGVDPTGERAVEIETLEQQLFELYRMDAEVENIGGRDVVSFPGGSAFSIPSLHQLRGEFFAAHPEIQERSPGEQALYAVRSLDYTKRSIQLAEYLLDDAPPEEARPLVDLVLQLDSPKKTQMLIEFVSDPQSEYRLALSIAQAGEIQQTMTTLENVDHLDSQRVLITLLCKKADGLSLAKALALSSYELHEQIVDTLIVQSEGLTEDPKMYQLGLKTALDKVNGAQRERILRVFLERDNPDLAQLAIKHLAEESDLDPYIDVIVRHQSSRAAGYALRNSLSERNRLRLESVAPRDGH